MWRHRSSSSSTVRALAAVMLAAALTLDCPMPGCGSTSPSNDGGAALQLLWSTPFYKARSGIATGSAVGLMAELERAVTHEYLSFRDSVWATDCRGDDTCVTNRRRSGDLALRPNEQFFQFQRERFEVDSQAAATAGSEGGGGGALASLFGGGGGGGTTAPFTGLGSAFEALPVATALREEVLRHVNKYLGALGQPPLAEGDTTMFMWATAHNSCVGHLPHIHEDSMVSGVFYLTVPPGSGDLVLEDPRGMLPPFGNRLIFSPAAGDIVLFPPWLVHHVSPSCGTNEDQPRMSLAFNIIGDWATTADASIVMRV